MSSDVSTISEEETEAYLEEVKKQAEFLEDEVNRTPENMQRVVGIIGLGTPIMVRKALQLLAMHIPITVVAASDAIPSGNLDELAKHLVAKEYIPRSVENQFKSYPTKRDRWTKPWLKGTKSR